MTEVTAIVTVAVTAASATVWETDWCGHWWLPAALRCCSGDGRMVRCGLVS
jgi:hypothetical protein